MYFDDPEVLGAKEGSGFLSWRLSRIATTSSPLSSVLVKGAGLACLVSLASSFLLLQQ